MDEVKIYLAGPITGKNLEEARQHRAKISEKFTIRGLGTISPLRHKKEEKKYDYRPQEIIDRDEMDIRRADAILCDYTDPNHAYIGTSMEIMYAYLHEKPVFVVAGDGAKNHYWIQYHATQVFSDFEEAAEYILEFFS